jgi:hypothetical protein
MFRVFTERIERNSTTMAESARLTLGSSLGNCARLWRRRRMTGVRLRSRFSRCSIRASRRVTAAGHGSLHRLAVLSTLSAEGARSRCDMTSRSVPISIATSSIRTRATRRVGPERPDTHRVELEGAGGFVPSSEWPSTCQRAVAAFGPEFDAMRAKSAPGRSSSSTR